MTAGPASNWHMSYSVQEFHDLIISRALQCSRSFIKLGRTGSFWLYSYSEVSECFGKRIRKVSRSAVVMR